ncbi:MAG: hypothetical protein NC828_01200 [Candidatus Omnitrophica bacterium]|nr:hypothetical protein [Candidatus Omnitrophota bacterium]
MRSKSLSPKAVLPYNKPLMPIKILKLEILNIILVFLLLGLLIYFIPLFFKRPESAIKNLEAKIKFQMESPNQIEKESISQPFSYFAEQVGSKTIFAPAVTEEITPKISVEEGPKLEDVKAQLNLLGVISGDNPQAIIEDKKTQKTYFLNRGSMFDDVVVKDILENKVILIYKEEEFELVL